MSMTEAERRQAIKFQDAIGEIVDDFLREGMKPKTIKDVLQDESTSDLAARQRELAGQ